MVTCDYTELYQYGVIVDTTDLSEHHIYGNSRLGVQWYPTGTMRQTYDVNPATPRLTKLTDSTVWFSYPYYDLIKKGQKEPYGQGHTDTMYVSRALGYRQYEMTDHLGNVLATILDRKTGIDTASADTIAFYNPDIASSQDYYPFGMRMGERHSEINDTIYRYAFNGEENDNEVYGTFKFQDYGMRKYNPLIVRFVTLDPISKSFPELTPYQFGHNNPIQNIDLDGKEGYRAAFNWMAKDAGFTTATENEVVRKFNETVEQTGRMGQDVLIVSGAVASVVASGGASLPVLLMGTVAIAGGTAKFYYDATGDYEMSNQIPTTITGTVLVTANLIDGENRHFTQEFITTAEFAEGLITFKLDKLTKLSTLPDAEQVNEALNITNLSISVVPTLSSLSTQKATGEGSVPNTDNTSRANIPVPTKKGKTFSLPKPATVTQNPN